MANQIEEIADDVILPVMMTYAGDKLSIEEIGKMVTKENNGKVYSALTIQRALKYLEQGGEVIKVSKNKWTALRSGENPQKEVNVMRNPAAKYANKSLKDRLGLDQYPNFSSSGSIKGMKDRFYGKNAYLVRSGSYIYNVPKEVYDQVPPFSNPRRRPLTPEEMSQIEMLAGYGRWSDYKIAKDLGVPVSAVKRFTRQMGLNPLPRRRKRRRNPSRKSNTLLLLGAAGLGIYLLKKRGE